MHEACQRFLEVGCEEDARGVGLGKKDGEGQVCRLGPGGRWCDVFVL